MRLLEIDDAMGCAHFWDDPDPDILKTRGELERMLSEHDALVRMRDDARELLSWDDASADDEAQTILGQLDTQLEHTQHRLMYPDPDHALGALVTWSAGAGGQEAQHWIVAMLAAYTKWAQSRGWETTLMSWSDGGQVGLARSVTLRVDGEYAFGGFRAEDGVHRFCRVSPFDSAGRVHTSFVSMEALPLRDDEDVEIDIHDSDLVTTTYLSSGPGGQHANKADTAVRMRHVPTGVVVSCQAHRGQQANRAEARRMLASRLEAMRRADLRAEQDARHAARCDTAFGHQVRSYELHQGRYIKDHRTGRILHRVDDILDGDFDELIRATLLRRPQLV